MFRNFNLKKVLISICCVFVFIPFKANAYVDLEIKNSEIEKISILFSRFKYVENKTYINSLLISDEVDIEDLRKEQQEKAERFAKLAVITVINDLRTTNLFQSITNGKDDSELPNVDLMEFPDFKIYADAGIEAILTGSYQMNEVGEIELKVRLWDILDERQLFGKFYTSPFKSWRKMGHKIANEIYMSLTGESSGHFDSRITYVAESGKARERKRRIAIMSFDGSQRMYLTDGKNNALTPIFSRDNEDEVIYMEYKERIPFLYKMNIKDFNSVKIGDFNEMTFSPNYNPNGGHDLLLSAVNYGITNIYRVNMLNNRSEKLTFTKDIDTTPSYSPDGKKVVFSSDRSGVQKLYVMNRDGTRTKKVTHGRGDYAKPAWSPDGRLIAFIRSSKGRFSVGVITPNGENERIMVSDYMIDGVKWSPNGRYLIYSKQGSAFGRNSIPQIYILDILTGFEKRLPTPHKEGATDPDWVNNK